MNKQKNETPEEQFERINRNLKVILWHVDKMLAKNKELKARNEELEKENKKLHETILKMSQEKC